MFHRESKENSEKNGLTEIFLINFQAFLTLSFFFLLSEVKIFRPEMFRFIGAGDEEFHKEITKSLDTQDLD